MPHDDGIKLWLWETKNFAHSPECPPNVKTHCVQPKESSQKEEMNANSWKVENKI